MNYQKNEFLCAAIGLRPDQVHSTYAWKNLWWSFDYGETMFGFGDICDADVQKIRAYLEREDTSHKVFTGWNENHGSKFQKTSRAIIRISATAGLTRPDMAVREIKVGG